MRDKPLWIPYIKPTQRKHESGWRIFEVGYMTGDAKAEKVVPVATVSDHIVLYPLFGEGSIDEPLRLNMDLTQDGYIRIFSSNFKRSLCWPPFIGSDACIIGGEPPVEKLEEMWKKLQEEK